MVPFLFFMETKKLEDLFNSYIKELRKGNRDGVLLKTLILTLEETESNYTSDEISGDTLIQVQFPDDYYPIEVKLESFTDFRYVKQISGTVMGWIGSTSRDPIFVHMSASDHNKLYKYVQNHG